MITPEEMAKFELLFEELKLVLLSESQDKFNTAISIIIKLMCIKNGGNQSSTARDMNISVKTIRSHLRGYDSKKEMIDLHLNMLACNKWFADLPLPEREECVSMVMDYYDPPAESVPENLL